jgi:glycosyltransferase involved in cell wall biosynthesis
MKILLIANEAFSFLHFRKALLRRLVSEGHDVHVVVPPSPSIADIETLGITVTPIDMPRFVSPLQDLRLVLRIRGLCRREKFDIVHNSTTKPNIYGTIGARLAGVPHIYGLVSGAGFTFMDFEGHRHGLTQKIILLLFRLAFSFTERVWFQNPDDAREFVERGLIAAGKPVVIKGSGVDPAYFTPGEALAIQTREMRRRYGITAPHCVLMVTARRIWSKGIREFVEAARLLETQFPDWAFVMVVPHDEGSPDLVPDEYFTNLPANIRVVEDFQHDIRPFYDMADIVTLPSYYREGVPRSLLEGMSFGCPVVTTDNIGCREAVVNNENGILVPVRDSAALARALASIMGDETRRKTMGAASRRLAESVFSEDHVVSEVIKRLYGLKAA